MRYFRMADGGNSQSSIQNAADRLQKFWGIALLVWTLGVIGATWAVADKYMNATKDNQIADLNRQIKDLKTVGPEGHEVLPDTDFVEGQSMTTKDGMLQLTVNNIYSGLGYATITVTVGAGKPDDFNYCMVGKRYRLDDYFIDIHRLTREAVTLSVSKFPGYSTTHPQK